MLDPGTLGGVLLMGGALSLPMYGGLWWTAQQLPSARSPWLFAVASFWARLFLTAAGFYLVMAGDWRRGLAALVGFLIGRTILLWWLGPPQPAAATKGA
jgi:F1F0 ATPase subunit 2